MKIRIMSFQFVALLSILCVGCNSNKVISLAGEWQLRLDSMDIGERQQWYDSSFVETITLPGTLDGASIGYPNGLQPTFEAPQIRHLIRKNSYIGLAWYTRLIEVPKSWEGRRIRFTFERVLWESNLWVDGEKIGSNNSLSTPHSFELNQPISAGKHRLTVCVDNRQKFDNSVVKMGHAYTDDTQITWNGVLGDMKMEVVEDVRIADIQLYPDVDSRTVKIVVALNNVSGSGINGDIDFRIRDKENEISNASTVFEVDQIADTIIYTYKLNESVALWDEFNPATYTIDVDLKVGRTSDSKSAVFGLRKLTNEKAVLHINHEQMFLRGTLECCIFPLTGTPPMDEESWAKLFGTVREWGLNHVRFHSWCPPKAAFNIADRMGLYLQIELPWWSYSVGCHYPTNDYMWKEALDIMREYGNHPSFCFWSMGNELEGDVGMLRNFVIELKRKDLRHLYTTTTFSFQQGVGAVAQQCDDYFVTQWTDKGWVRGQGVFNDESPSFDKDFGAAIDGVQVPIVSHEIGQYCIYPNLREIEKYKGVLTPLNFIAVKEDLKRKNLLDRADDYMMASGRLAAILYKEEIERAMKTKGFSGYQLLDLHDYPGQGTALVGLLDAFWDNKGIMAADEFRQFSSPVVPLLWFAKATYENNENFTAKVGLSNFGNTMLNGKNLRWSAVSSEGEIVKNGVIVLKDIIRGSNFELGTIDFTLNKQQKAEVITIAVSVDGTDYKNSWRIWVYPAVHPSNDGNVVVTSDVSCAKQALTSGRKVLFNPKWQQINGIEGKFVPVFWSPVHFPNQAGTMGVLCDPNHPALSQFPTDMNADWQWWDLNRNSTTLLLDSIPTVEPIVEMVDNFVKNRRLGLVFEANVGKGVLIFSAIDMLTDIENRPAARQLRYSLLEYMNSDKFKPKFSIEPQDIDKLLTDKSTSAVKKGSDNIYY